MRWLALAILLAGCGETAGPDTDLATPDAAVDAALDLALPDAALDLAPWCVANGPSPTCGGTPCAPGCWCIYGHIFLDGGGGMDTAQCDCARPAPPSPNPNEPGGILCCGGVYCPWNPSAASLRCSPQNDCNIL